MPSAASACWKARRCNGSLSAMTPSKSKTIACSAPAMSSDARHLFAGEDGHLQPVRRRRIRALVRLVVGAGRVVGEIEVDRVETGRGWRNVEVTARLVSVLPGGEIGKRNEQVLNLPRAGRDERTEAHLLSVQ